MRRRCAHCRAFLRSTNPESVCDPCQRAEAARVVIDTRPPREPSRYASKLTWTQVRQIRARHAQGETPTEIARDLRVSRSTVGDVIAGRTWVEAA